jgi:hypothetical protein
MPFTTLNDEEEKELWRLASLGASMAIRLILTEKWASTSRRWRTVSSANLSWNPVSSAIRLPSPSGGLVDQSRRAWLPSGQRRTRIPPAATAFSLHTRIDPNVGGFGAFTPSANRSQQYRVPMVFQKSSLPRRERSHVNRLLRWHAHPLQRRSIRYQTASLSVLSVSPLRFGSPSG